jgi:uncharacterized protein
MTREVLIGREPEIAVLQETLVSNRAELVALYGRRRVGKTFLVENVFRDQMIFSFVGQKNGSLQTQLNNFRDRLQDTVASTLPFARPKTWSEAFQVLRKVIEADTKQGKKVVFIDEFPWLDSPRSGYLVAFDYFWNSWGSKRNDLVVVICGSAASWMIKNVVRNRGGLHNRLTRRLRLQPFNLHESELFLRSRGVNLERYQLLQLYMVTGGIPQYLIDVKPGESATQNIDRMCFAPEGWLKGEFEELYHALFDDADKHLLLVRLFSEAPYGLNRAQLLAATGWQTGGSVSQLIDELTESGFVTAYIPFHKTQREAIYKLTDPFSLFYFRFMEMSRSAGRGSWIAKSKGAVYETWKGYAFENICMLHLAQIKRALNIGAVYTEHSIWRFVPKKGEASLGAQIDLVLDRNDQCINLVEIKFHNQPYALNKQSAELLRQKEWVFREQTKTRKTLFTTIVSAFGVKPNEHSIGLVQSQVLMADLFLVV